ncbi:MAG TPA: VOC family protein [Acidimicrobiales bacterium]|nr:VOC family protein [Acidimicrobiales bacterium]
MGHRLVAIDHVQLAMPPGGEDEATAFYEGILGLERRPKPPALEARGGCWFANDDVVLHLGVEESFRAAVMAHPPLVVDGFEALVSAREDAGHRVRPDHDLPGTRRSYVDDPFGNRIELIDAASVDRQG